MSIVRRLRSRTLRAPRAVTTLPGLGAAHGLVSRHNYLAAIEQAIEAFGRSGLRDLVIVNPGKPVKTGNVYSQRYPDARIHVLAFTSLAADAHSRARSNVVLRTCRGIDGAHDYLTTVSPPQVLIDSCTFPEQKTKALLELLFHVADGGLYVIEPRERSRTTPPGAPVETASEALARLREIKTSPAARKRASSHDVARADAIGEVDTDRGVTSIRKHGRHLLKLRDAAADRVLEARHGSGWGQTLERLPAQDFRSAATVWANGPVDTFTTEMMVPELYVREYCDVVCAPRQLAIQDDIVLPISFHHRLHKPIWSRALTQRDASQWMVTVDDSIAAAARLPGAFYHLDSEYPWHFGHFMTEDIARLWGWRLAKRRYPELKALISTWNPDTRSPGTGPTRHQLTVFDAYGIAAQDIVCIDTPVRVDLLVGASQMLYNPRHARYVHPGLVEVWDDLRDALRTPASTLPERPRKLFVSRGGDLNRSCRNADDVEKLFESNGFTIVRPEQFDIPGQVDLFAGADVVAGFGGSAMFNMIYCENPGKRIIIAPTGYGARNEYLISSLRGDDYYHFFCPPDISHPPGGWSRDAFFSSFEFDFASDGDALQRVLNE